MQKRGRKIEGREEGKEGEKEGEEEGREQQVATVKKGEN